jgi:hypothetical protein
MTLTLGVVCEAAADKETGCRLADRVIWDEIEWITAEDVNYHRQWRGIEPEQEYLRWREVPTKVDELGIRIHGHFGGEPGAPDARVAREALALFNAADPKPDAIVLLRDDDRQTERRKGLEQARSYMEPRLQLPIVIGLAHVMRECWVVAGFEPQNEDESERIETVRRELGCDPTLSPEKLTAKTQTAKRSPKRVLRFLSSDDRDREAACWQKTSLSTLVKRGKYIGLAEYLREVCEKLVPLFTGNSGQQCGKYSA